MPTKNSAATAASLQLAAKIPLAQSNAIGIVAGRDPGCEDGHDRALYRGDAQWMEGFGGARELGLPYTVRALSLGKLEQKEDWFLSINPNGRVPAIIDHRQRRLRRVRVRRHSYYLAEKTGKLLPATPRRVHVCCSG
jgi:hypothetical protein